METFPTKVHRSWVTSYGLSAVQSSDLYNVHNFTKKKT